MTFGNSFVMIMFIAVIVFKIKGEIDFNNQFQALAKDKWIGCDIPKIDPFAKEMMQFVKEYPPILSKCTLDPFILKITKHIRCTYRDIIYESDDKYTLGPEAVVYGDQEHQLNKSDQVQIVCENLDFRHGLHNWSGLAMALRPVSVKAPPPGRERSYNVLIVGFDSTSRNGFIRKMPKSYAFIKNELKATVLNSYSIVGNASVAALSPTLTGKTEPEMPECRKSINNNVHMKHLIYFKLKKDGYRTAYFEDLPNNISTPQLRFKCFLQQLADHSYLSYFDLEAVKLGQKLGVKKEPLCIGDTSQYRLMLNLTDQFFQLDGKKFAFTFMVDIAHNDINWRGSADEQFREFMKRLMHRGVFRNTLLMIMGNHGPRHTGVRGTLQGKLEERLPLMAIRLPDEMSTQRPDAQLALEMNADVLTTPHDIYATVLDAVDMREHWHNYKVKGADLMRALTLLEPIPKYRSCSEAGIERHWCFCLSSHVIDKKDKMCKRIAQVLMNKINAMTDFVRSKCAFRTLKTINWVKQKLPNDKVLFQEPGDYNLSLTKNIDMEIYDINITIGRDNSTYEATVWHNIKERKLNVVPSTITRINGYDQRPVCVSSYYPYLTPFCYCT